MGDLVIPDTIRYSLSQGRFIEFKKYLTHGESEDMSAGMLHPVKVGETPLVNTKEIRTRPVLTYLVAWSLSLPINPHLPEAERYCSIRAIDSDTFNEIFGLLQTHISAMEQEKKLMAGATQLVAI
jgi:hypothetical protein